MEGAREAIRSVNSMGDRTSDNVSGAGYLVKRSVGLFGQYIWACGLLVRAARWAREPARAGSLD